ncbi:hypothetical protein [Pseudoroseicyclus sp. CXY001]|uniref:hypothetical protein n=1 Tax=Pseudoroseicyclus sp. CXY001 TaxID=3242492 RepID=UPI003570F098
MIGPGRPSAMLLAGGAMALAGAGAAQDLPGLAGTAAYIDSFALEADSVELGSGYGALSNSSFAINPESCLFTSTRFHSGAFVTSQAFGADLDLSRVEAVASPASGYQAIFAYPVPGRSRPHESNIVLPEAPGFAELQPGPGVTCTSESCMIEMDAPVFTFFMRGDEEDAARAVRALEHAISLCGGIADPFAG